MTSKTRWYCSKGRGDCKAILILTEDGKFIELLNSHDHPAPKLVRMLTGEIVRLQTGHRDRDLLDEGEIRTNSRFQAIYTILFSLINVFLLSNFYSILNYLFKMNSPSPRIEKIMLLFTTFSDINLEFIPTDRGFTYTLNCQ